MFEPITLPMPAQLPPEAAAMPSIEAPILPPPPPPGIAFKAEKPNKKLWDISVVRRAQGIYPAEAQAKANQIQTAKMPTPTGAWGAPG